MAAYLVSHGFCVELSLRPGTQHSAKHTDDDLRRIVPLAQRLSAAGPKAPLMARLDSGFDSSTLMACIDSMNRPDLPPVDWIIKWHPRSTDAAARAAELDAAGTTWERPRVGKRVATWELTVEAPGVQGTVRRVLRFVERTIGSLGPELIYRAGRQVLLEIGAHDRAASAFMRLHAQFARKSDAVARLHRKASRTAPIDSLAMVRPLASSVNRWRSRSRIQEKAWASPVQAG